VRDAATIDDYHPETVYFERRLNAFGPQALELEVAGIGARLEGLSSEQKSQLAARYGVFARRDASPAPDLVVSVRHADRTEFLKLRVGGVSETYRLLTRFEGEDLLAWSYEWAALVRFDGHAATLAAASSDRAIFDRCIENFLRVAFAHLALARGGVLMHAAGVVRNGRAYVFFGPSGSGKTTTTLMSAGDLVLSDDLLMIVRDGAGFAATSVPFRGLVTPGATTNSRYPLAGLFRLVQDDRDFLEDLGRPQAVGQIVQSLPFVTDRAESAPRILDVVSEMAFATPVKKLHFRKDPGFWRIVENVGGSAAEAP